MNHEEIRVIGIVRGNRISSKVYRVGTRRERGGDNKFGFWPAWVRGERRKLLSFLIVFGLSFFIFINNRSVS